MKIGSQIFEYCIKKNPPNIQDRYHIMDNKIHEFYYKHAYKVMKIQITNYKLHVHKLMLLNSPHTFLKKHQLHAINQVQGWSVTHPKIIRSILVNKN